MVLLRPFSAHSRYKLLLFLVFSLAIVSFWGWIDLPSASTATTISFSSAVKYATAAMALRQSL